MNAQPQSIVKKPLQKDDRELVACDLCGGIDPRTLMSVQDRIYEIPGEFSLVQCGYCGLIYLNPRPTPGAIGKYYPDLAYHAFKAAGGIKARVQESMRQREADSLLEGLPAHPHVLEIGCATGDMLVALRERGADGTGIERNAAAVEMARGRELKVEIGTLGDVSLPPASFDLVVMKYALEHVHSPRNTIGKIKTLLKPKGRAVFWVPNMRSWES